MTSAPASPQPLTLVELAGMDVTRLRGVGPKRAQGLALLGILSVADLLTHYPRRYVDRTREAVLAELRAGEEATVVVRVEEVTTRRTRKGQAMTTVRALDGHGSSLGLTFFNQAWRERQLSPGAMVVVFGRLELFRGARRMTAPVVDLIGDRTGRIVPIYPQSEKARLSTWEIAELVEEALRRAEARRGFADPVPASWRRQLELIDRGSALRAIHAPESMAAVHVARKRLAFDELLRVQLALVQRKRVLEHAAKGIRHRHDGPLLGSFLSGLPFPLTAAQRRVIAEIGQDLARPLPMHRLLQGDVGAGKTVVAVAALLMAIEGGYQGALMAPTEVLAEQHFSGVRQLLSALTLPDPSSLLDERPVRVELLTHRTGAAERRRILAGLATPNGDGQGHVDLLVGTHALLQDNVTFAALGAVVIDEQHRFGVEQRDVLRARGSEGAAPDVLVMTATPIPRTAAMTVYGDLDVSVLDELPPGRTPIDTVWASDLAGEGEAWAAVRAAVAAGHQGYVVTPLVEESDKLEVASAEATFERLSGDELSGLRLGLLHGRLSPADKDAVMESFRAGSLDVLVATTVIEVGVDVPNATVMVILDADRFGIAQLHQLRGRVGRGRNRSSCYLVANLAQRETDPSATEVAQARLTALVRSTDGFELAEVDLELRGEGTIMGARQKGRNDLKLASLRRDKDLVVAARRAALELIDERGDLGAHPALDDEVRALLGEDETAFLLKS